MSELPRPSGEKFLEAQLKQADKTLDDRTARAEWVDYVDGQFANYAQKRESIPDELKPAWSLMHLYQAYVVVVKEMSGFDTRRLQDKGWDALKSIAGEYLPDPSSPEFKFLMEQLKK